MRTNKKMATEWLRQQPGYSVLTSGGKAYYDTFSGLIPCVVLGIAKTPFGFDATIRLTAKRGAYRRGEVLTARTSHVVPRKAVHYRCGIARIWAYEVQP